MCGIFGAVSQNKNIIPSLITGLKQLEYRGYDSAGIAYLHGGYLERIRKVGRVSALESESQNKTSTIGIGHTRWATHGGVKEVNAHPHCSDHLAVVHNGIIDNFEAERAELIEAGYQFLSDTDTEVIAHRLHFEMAQGATLFEAVRLVGKRLTGAYAFVVLDEHSPDQLIALCKGCPLLLGFGEACTFIASDIAAILSETEQVLYLEEGDLIAFTAREILRCETLTGQKVSRETFISDLSLEALELGNYQHFMQKEIFNQPDVLQGMLQNILSRGFVADLFGREADAIFPKVKRIKILACGTSYFAGKVAKTWFETLAKLPTDVEISSEYRYRERLVESGEMVITLSQSGETLDTIEALKHAKVSGVMASLSICNVRESVLPRMSDCVFYTNVGVEVGVASTKAFTAQLVALFVLANTLANVQHCLDSAQLSEHLKALKTLPSEITQALLTEERLKTFATQIARREHALYLGRGMFYPIAEEGALKLKEISYIHAESYPAGELKHGPLALVDESMPVIVLAPNDALLEKIRGNMHEVSARGGELFVISDGGDFSDVDADHTFTLPATHPLLRPIVFTIAVQLLAYHVANIRGEDIDKPRNLAKSLTVE